MITSRVRALTLASALVVFTLRLSAAQAGFDEDKCNTTHDGYSCIKAARAFHRDQQLAAILKTGDAAKLKAYRDKVEQLDLMLCNTYNEESNCRYVIEVLKLDPPSEAINQRIADLQTKMCVKGMDPVCAELKYQKGLGGLSEEQACLQKNYADACFRLAAQHSTDLDKLGDKGDPASRKQRVAKIVALLDKYCDANVQRACDQIASALLRGPRGPESDEKLLKTQQKLCALGSAVECTNAQRRTAPMPANATPNAAEESCTPSTLTSCYVRSQEYYTGAMQARRANNQALFMSLRAKAITLATRVCELKKPEGCSVAQRAIEAVETPTDADFALVLKLFDVQCKQGVARACQLFKERQASGGKPKERVPRTKDVAAVLAQLKQNGTLAGANLAGKELEGINLRSANLKGANLKGAYLASAQLSSANLDNAILDGAILEKADLSQMTLNDASARGAVFFDGTGYFAQVRGAHFENASIGQAICQTPDLTDVHLEGAKLHHCQWNGRDLRKLVLRGTTFHECDLTSANLSGVDLTGADLRQTKVERSNFAGAKLDRAQLEGMMFSDTDLTNASLIEAQGAGAFFSTRSLSGANFSRANLRDAKFIGATTLAGARFERAIVCGTGIEKVQGWTSAYTSGAQKTCD